ncbi:MAG: SusC/RagA family TonB-linked outer membrane protein [Dysgonamonadaceae bacterium]|jgi:TonB-linked SusC/RagA family outer membrane protein|nr:SusC/RagA family TonB-linked outer membrane protein [Dysgonamonadaceae bacterium]
MKWNKQPYWLLLCLLMLFPFGLRAQTNLVTLRATNQPLGQVIKELNRVTQKDYLYSNQEVDADRLVTVVVSDRPLEEVLRTIFGSRFRFEITPKVVVIRPVTADGTTQTKTKLSGTVRDGKGETLPGVTVRVKGTTIGTVTDENGNYSLELPEQQDLAIVFSFIGMKQKELKYTGNNTLNVTLQEDVAVLEDVVVTGYADVRKSSFTGSVTQVTKDEVLKVSSQNLIDALQVFDPSLRVIQNTEMGSDPNTLPEFYLRGRSGIGVKELDAQISQETGLLSQYNLATNPNLPVFILDGFEVDLQKIYDLDLNRIENINILKDAAATAIYGSRASNGVIVITTVAPRPGELHVSYIGNYAMTLPDLTSYNLMNAQEKLDAEVAADLFEPWRVSSGGSQTPEQERRDLYRYYLMKKNNILIGVDNYWLSQPLSTMFNNQHSARIDGGNQTIRFGLEANYNGQNGVMKDSYRDRVGVGMDLDYRYKGLQIRNQVTYAEMKAQDSPYGTFRDYTNKHPYDRWSDDEGNLVKNLQQWGNGLPNPVNPLYEATLGNFSRNGNKELADNFFINLNLTNDWFIKGQFAISSTDAWAKNFTDPKSATYAANADLFTKGELYMTNTTTNRWNFNLFSAYNLSLDSHFLSLSAGVNASSTNYEFVSESYRGFANAELNSPAYAAEFVSKPIFSDNKTRLFGSFFTANYTYRNIYLLDASARIDGSSEFGVERKWAPFWAIGTGLNVHNYEWLKPVTWLNMLRIVGNVGETGKTNFQPYMAQNTYSIMLDSWYPTGIGGELIYLGNEGLTWETTTSWNIRTEIGVLKDRFHLKWDLYRKVTSNLVTDVDLPTSSGFKQYTDNMGENLNKGFELDLKAQAYSTRDLEVNLFGNMAHNRNEILKISESLKRYNERIDNYYENYGMNNTVGLIAIFQVSDYNTIYSKPYMKYEEGSSLTAIYGMKSLGINPANGKEVYVKRDGTITYDWESSEQQKIGDTEPWAQGSFGVNARYKNFMLYATFLYEFGGDQYNYTLVNNVENANLQYYNADRRVLTQRWQNIGDYAPLKSIQDRYYVTRPTSRFVQKNNYTKFNSLSLSYDLNQALVKKFNLSMLRVTFNMKDIFTISSIEREMGLSYPYAHTYTLSLNIGL